MQIVFRAVIRSALPCQSYVQERRYISMKQRLASLIIDCFLAIGTALSVALSGMTAFSARAENVCGEVLRLHIPANSDSERDQQLKLGLRDELLSHYGRQLSDSGTLACAEERVQALLPEITEFSCRYLRGHGADYGARAELVTMYFTTRRYDAVTLPAGEYRALRVTLGSGEGHNWWCVMFPPLCLPAASAALPDDEARQLAAELGEDFDSSTPQVRFAIYEWLKGLFS